MSNEPLSEGELTKKYPKRAELLKALGINILKGHPNSLASNITIPELENCHECNEEILLNPPKAFTTLVCGHILHHDCLERSNRDKQKTCPICFVDNEGTASAEVQNIDMSEVVEDEGEETSNLTGAVSKLSVDDGKAIPRSETKSMEPDKVQGLIKELSMPKKRVTRAYQEEIRCWYLFAEKFEERVKEIKNDNSKYNDQQARGLVYGEVATNLLRFTRDSLRKKTAKARNIYKLFGESYDPDIKKIRLGIQSTCTDLDLRFMHIGEDIIATYYSPESGISLEDGSTGVRFVTNVIIIHTYIAKHAKK
ncbi:8195_t:CDS:2 [Ambispora leptoticha]|uniref:8195_t:CDS:1 n=1 Tax=Ambispora leptoticha TaxID=144679 RepID=A0A9N9HQL8_9GLOM|nr:8195_t:CDS:2 [Ambispora leptoticha]